jgi:hypothetical protein
MCIIAKHYIYYIYLCVCSYELERLNVEKQVIALEEQRYVYRQGVEYLS